MKIIMAAIKNVAKLAGISPSITSRALHDMISQTTKERVRQAMKELNYSPNYSAQMWLKSKPILLELFCLFVKIKRFSSHNHFRRELLLKVMQDLIFSCVSLS